MAALNVIQFPINTNTVLPVAPAKRGRGRPRKLPPGVVRFPGRETFSPTSFAVGGVVRVRSPADERNIGKLAHVVKIYHDGCVIESISGLFHIWAGEESDRRYGGLNLTCFLPFDCLVPVANTTATRTTN